MTEIYNFLPRQPSIRSGESVFAKETTEWRDKVLNRDHADHINGALMNRPRCRRIYYIGFTFSSADLKSNGRGD